VTYSRSWLFAVLALLVSATGAARADQAADAAEARRFYEQGTKKYSMGDFPKAIELYKKAFDLLPDPVFLYNIAQAYRLSDNFKQAQFFYKSYLRNAPNAANRAEVEARIAELESMIARSRQTAESPPTGPVPPEGGPPSGGRVRIPSASDAADASDEGEGEESESPPAAPTDADTRSRPIYKKWWFWAGIGAVAVGATIAVIAVSGGDPEAPETTFGNTALF